MRSSYDSTGDRKYLEMRLAVYKAGVKAGYWKNLDEEGI